MFQNIYLTQWFYVLLSTQFFLHECENSRAFSIFASVCVSKQKANLFCFFYFLKERQEVEFWVSCSQLYSWHLYKYRHIRNSVNTYRNNGLTKVWENNGRLSASLINTCFTSCMSLHLFPQLQWLATDVGLKVISAHLSYFPPLHWKCWNSSHSPHAYKSGSALSVF